MFQLNFGGKDRDRIRRSVFWEMFRKSQACRCAGMEALGATGAIRPVESMGAIIAIGATEAIGAIGEL
jgi:hypothetical protein